MLRSFVSSVTMNESSVCSMLSDYPTKVLKKAHGLIKLYSLKGAFSKQNGITNERQRMEIKYPANLGIGIVTR